MDRRTWWYAARYVISLLLVIVAVDIAIWLIRAAL